MQWFSYCNSMSVQKGFYHVLLNCQFEMRILVKFFIHTNFALAISDVAEFTSWERPAGPGVYFVVPFEGFPLLSPTKVNV